MQNDETSFESEIRRRIKRNEPSVTIDVINVMPDISKRDPNTTIHIVASDLIGNRMFMTAKDFRISADKLKPEMDSDMAKFIGDEFTVYFKMRRTSAETFDKEVWRLKHDQDHKTRQN
jgi:hypothetical protein